MTKEEINAQIKAVEKIKGFYESERDDILDKIVAETEKGIYPPVDKYLYCLCEIEWLGRELKRLGTEIGNPPYDGDNT